MGPEPQGFGLLSFPLRPGVGALDGERKTDEEAVAWLPRENDEAV